MCSTEQHEAPLADATSLSASAIIALFNDLGIESALGKYRGFINVDTTLLLSDAIELLPPGKIGLEILQSVGIKPEIEQRCAQLKALGFELALDDFSHYSEAYRGLLAIVDIVKVDVRALDHLGLLATTQELKKWRLRMLAKGVETRAQFEQCAQLGFELFQGYYFARPDIISGKRLSAHELVLLRLLALVIADADTATIEALFKQEPGMSVNLLRLTNSVGTGLEQKISSLKQAIIVLGRRQLQRWLQLLMFAGSAKGGDFPGPLLQLAATRARLMELLAGQCHGASRDLEDRAFMTGIISLMDTLFGVTLREILDKLNLAQDVRAALLEHSGTVGSLLALVQALERNDGARVLELVTPIPGLGIRELNAAHIEALRWANALATVGAH